VNKPVLVTGGAGSVGSQVVKRLQAEGQLVRVFDLPGLDYTGLEGIQGVEIVRGDITQENTVFYALEDVCAVIHLAAILSPASEQDRDLTFAVNAKATLSLARGINRVASNTPFVFSSSVNTYGDTTGEEPPIAVEHSQHASDIYAESKIAAEKVLRETCPHAVILRISGISIPAFREPPEAWPFKADQRIEFVHRDDVVTALCASVDAEEARGQVFNVAGGYSWRTTGWSYVKDYYELLGVPIGEASFRDYPGWFDWYDTSTSQRVLKYQNTSYGTYLGQIEAEIRNLSNGNF
jgi:nucleoside-diphosphate-sugar epimerase